MDYDPTIIEERLVCVAERYTALIAAAPYIVRAPAISTMTERKGDLSAEIQAALNRLGASIAIVMPDGEDIRFIGGDTLSMRVRLVAEITENVLIAQGQAKATNTRYRPALALAVAAMKAVSKQPNGLDPVGQMHRAGLNEFEVEPFRQVIAPRPTYHVTAYTTVQL